jgi:hypothetical protein
MTYKEALEKIATVNAMDYEYQAWAREALAKQEQDVDWKDMYEKEKRRSAMWVAKYEKDIGPLERATPQQEQGEPVAKVCHDLDGHIGWNPSLTELPDEGTKLYTTPQQRKPLTDEQIEQMWQTLWGDQWTTKGRRNHFARAIEAAHGIKE